jgi:hypothetical protein
MKSPTQDVGGSNLFSTFLALLAQLSVTDPDSLIGTGSRSSILGLNTDPDPVLIRIEGLMTKNLKKVYS